MNIERMISDEKSTKNETRDEIKDKEKETCVLLIKNPNRLVMTPIIYHDVYEMYKRHIASFWTAEDIDLTADIASWNSLNKDERYFIQVVLAFFVTSEGIVIENLAQRFLRDVQLPEAVSFYSIQIGMEAIHAETYALLIQTYCGHDRATFDNLIRAVETMPCITNKAKWAVKWSESNRPFSHRLLAFAALEGIFFSGSFCAVFWLKKRGLMPGFSYSNELISRDEGLHCEFACLLYNKFCEHLEDSVVHEIIHEAVEIEKSYVCSALPVELIGMNSTLMSQYIEFVADRFLTSIHHPKLYNAENPFEWMELISMEGKANFFEKRSLYSLPRVAITEEDREKIKSAVHLKIDIESDF